MIRIIYCRDVICFALQMFLNQVFALAFRNFHVTYTTIYKYHYQY